MIRKILNDTTFEHRHLDDVKRIQRVLLAHGYESDLESAADIWDEYSDSMAAGWMFLPPDDLELWWRISEIVERKAE